jgi:hypothetical protein
VPGCVRGGVAGTGRGGVAGSGGSWVAGTGRGGAPGSGGSGVLGSARETVTGKRVLRLCGHLITSRMDEKRPTYPSIVSD